MIVLGGIRIFIQHTSQAPCIHAMKHDMMQIYYWVRVREREREKKRKYLYFQCYLWSLNRSQKKVSVWCFRFRHHWNSVTLISPKWNIPRYFVMMILSVFLFFSFFVCLTHWLALECIYSSVKNCCIAFGDIWLIEHLQSQQMLSVGSQCNLVLPHMYFVYINIYIKLQHRHAVVLHSFHISHFMHARRRERECENVGIENDQFKWLPTNIPFTTYILSFVFEYKSMWALDSIMQR